MFQFLRGVALIAAMMLNCGVTFADTDRSANHFMTSCRAFFTVHNTTVVQQAFDIGFCAGLVIGLGSASPNICPESGVTDGQAVRVVVKYIDDRPQRLHEDFRALAVEALRAAWPCKN
jgi:Rap1a immunity proteins